MNKFVELLKETSTWGDHPYNQAKEFLIFDDGEVMEVGVSCFYNKAAMRWYRTDYENGKVYLLDRKDRNFTLTFGISLHNMIVLLERKGCVINNIVRVISDVHYSKNGYVIYLTYKGHISKSFEFSEYGKTLEEFYFSEIASFLIEIYEKE